MAEVSIYIPCEVFPVTHVSAASETVSPLEELFLEALANGVTRFHDVESLFGLGYRPTLDLVSDLWQRGYVSVDLDSAEIVLDEELQARFRSARESGEARPFRDLGAGEMTERTESVMQELVSGHVIRVQRRPPRVEPRAVAPRFGLVGPVDRTEVADVLATTLQRTGSSNGRPLKVLHANLGEVDASGRPVHTVPRLMEVRVRPSYDEATDVIEVHVIPGAGLSAQVARSIGRELSRWYEDRSDHPFFTYLRAVAAKGATELGALPDEAVQRLAAATNSDTTHDRLVAMAAVALEHVASRYTAVANHEVLLGRQAHRKELTDLITGAERQIVIASSSLDYDELGLFEGLLHQAVVEREVNVFVLWSGTLEARVASTLDDLRRAAPHRMFWTAEPSRLRVSFAIGDDRELLFGSCPLLGKDTQPHLGVRVWGEARAEAAVGFLRQARSLYPEYRHVERLSSFPAANTAPARAVPVPPTAGFEPAWRKAWQEFASELQGDLEDVGPGAVALTGARDHGEALRNALAGAESWLLVCSIRVDADVWTRYQPAVEELLRRGCTVAIVTRDRANGLVQRAFSTLQQQFPAFTHLHTAFAPGELLWWDSSVVVTHFPLLNRLAVADRRAREAAPVGLWLRGWRRPTQVDAIQDALGGARLGPPMPHAGTKRSVSGGLASEVHAFIGELHANRSSEEEATPTSSRVAEWLRRGTPWRRLEALVEAGYEHPAGAIATALAAEPEAPEGRAWVPTLVVETWNRGRYCESAALLAGWGVSATDVGGPPDIVARCAAYLDVPGPNPWLADLTLTEGDVELCTATVAIAAIVRLGGADNIATECLEMRAASVSPALSAFAKAVLQLSSARIDFESLRRARRVQEMRADATKRRAAVQLALSELPKRVLFGTGLGRLTWRTVVESASRLAPIIQAIKADDAVAGMRAVGRLPASDQELGMWLDAASAEAFSAAGQHKRWGDDDLLKGNRRAAFLQELRVLLDDVRTWAAGATLTDEGVDEAVARLEVAALNLREAPSPAGYSAALVATLLARVEPLVETTR